MAALITANPSPLASATPGRSLHRSLLMLTVGSSTMSVIVAINSSTVSPGSSRKLTFASARCGMTFSFTPALNIVRAVVVLTMGWVMLSLAICPAIKRSNSQRLLNKNRSGCDISGDIMASALRIGSTSLGSNGLLSIRSRALARVPIAPVLAGLDECPPGASVDSVRVT